jgi:asparagine synthase (glutamine-hydrolysing)
MCGIAGVLNLSGDLLEDPAVATRMASFLAHRGPDEEGSLKDGPIAFGFRRLSIIDLDGGHQPVANERETIWTMLNGEIYNFVELRDQLQQQGHRFRTQSDTEVIVHAYETHGLDFVEYLRGMFAIALWDSEKRRLILVRDRIGKKPLFWSTRNGQLAFASEIKALLLWPGLDRTLDPEAIHDYLSFLSVPAPKSIFKSVHKLSPAHLLIADTHTGRVETKRYWQVQPQPDRSKPRSYFVEGLRDLLEESVRLRLRSDVPVGALLSGGLDSTAVVGLMSKQPTAGAVKTFTMGFQDDRFDETHYARIAAQAFSTNHTEEVVGPISIELLQRLAWFLDEPFADSSAIPTYQVSRIARQYVTVALSGDGGDELFAGYPRYQYARRLRDLTRIPGPLRTGMKWLTHEGQRLLASRCYPGGEGLRRLGKALDLSRLSEPQRIMALLSYYDETDKRSLYHPEFAAQLNGYSSLNFVNGHLAKFSDGSEPLAAFMAHDLETNLADDSLVKVDRMSMACSLEMRSPLLDHKLVEFASTIPPEFKLQGKDTKLIFKEALSDVLPKDIAQRGKQGFAVPFGSWFNLGEWRVLLDDCLSADSVRRRAIFNPIEVDKMRRAILSEPAGHLLGLSTHQIWHRVWILIMFELWARQYLDRTAIACAA